MIAPVPLPIEVATPLPVPDEAIELVASLLLGIVEQDQAAAPEENPA